MKSVMGMLMALVFAMVLSMPTFAKDKNSGGFDLSQPAKVGSTELQPGHYTAAWKTSGNNVEVAILQHGKTIASAQAQLKQLPQPASQNAVTVAPVNNGKEVVEIDFSGHNQAIVFGG